MAVKSDTRLTIYVWDNTYIYLTCSTVSFFVKTNSWGEGEGALLCSDTSWLHPVDTMYQTSCIPHLALRFSCFLVQTNKSTIAKMFTCTVLFITPTCFGHSCNHLQGVGYLNSNFSSFFFSSFFIPSSSSSSCTVTFTLRKTGVFRGILTRKHPLQTLKSVTTSTTKRSANRRSWTPTIHPKNAHVQVQQPNQVHALSDKQRHLFREDATPDVVHKSALKSDNTTKPETARKSL
jgi:hypothetical protein